MKVLDAVNQAMKDNPKGELPLEAAFELAKVTPQTPREQQLIETLASLWKQLKTKEAILKILIKAEMQEEFSQGFNVEVQPRHEQMAKEILGETGINYVGGVPIIREDYPQKTIGALFRAILLSLWEEGDIFSAKRPLGQGDWDYALIEALASNGDLGEIESNEDESIIDALTKDQKTQAHKIIKNYIKEVFN